MLREAYDKQLREIEARHTINTLEFVREEHPRLPIEEAERRLEAELEHFFEVTHRYHLGQQRPPDELPYGSMPIEWLEQAPHLVLKAETGLGKTRRLAVKLLTKADHFKSRSFVIQPTYELAEQFVQTIKDVAVQLGLSEDAIPRITILKGIHQEGVCIDDGVNGERFRSIATLDDSAISPETWACTGCPIKRAKKCPYHKQFYKSSEAYKPGINIIVSSYLGADRIPGLVDETQNPKGAAPIFALFIDESALSATTAEHNIFLDSLDNFNRYAPHFDAEMLEVISNLKDALRQAEGAGKVSLEAFSTAGFFNNKALEPKQSKPITMPWWRWARRVAENYLYWARSEANELVKRERAKGAVELPSKSNALANLRNAKALHAFFELFYQQQIIGRDALYGVTVTKAARGELIVHMKWRKALRWDIAMLPTMYMDATADVELTPLFFNPWADAFFEDRFTRVDAGIYPAEVLKRYRHVDIRVQQPHMQLVKVLNAPTSMRALLSAFADGSSDKRLRRDTALEHVVRVVRCFGERLNDGSDSVLCGVIANKKVKEYLERHKLMPPNAKAGNFNAVQGLNDWELALLLFIVGRTMPNADDFAKSAYGFFALAPRGIKVDVSQPLTQGTRLINTAPGEARKIRSTVCPDPLADRLLQQIVAAPVAQAIGRGRGVRASADRPLIVFDLSDAATELEYAAGIDWLAIASIDEFDVLSHGAGFVPEKASDQMRAVPQLFASRDAARDFKRGKTASGKKSGMRLYSNNNIYEGHSHFLTLNDQLERYTIWGQPSHYLLQPRQLVPAELNIKNAPMRVLLDPEVYKTVDDVKRRTSRKVLGISLSN